MSHGISPIIKRSSIDEETRLKLLNHPFFDHICNYSKQDHIIDKAALSDYDKKVLHFLDNQSINYDHYAVEYWFQYQHGGTPASTLDCHCDYNFVYRDKMKFEGNDWPHKVERSLIVSPMTIAIYLETKDLEGGELCVSYRTWMEDPYPIAVEQDKSIKLYDYYVVVPKQREVLYFKGSEHYHWINKVTRGSRKSILINFWPPEVFDTMVL